MVCKKKNLFRGGFHVYESLVSFLRNISLALRTFLLLAGWLDSESESATSTVVAVL
jgi:hypothetical protein